MKNYTDALFEEYFFEGVNGKHSKVEVGKFLLETTDVAESNLYNDEIYEYIKVSNTGLAYSNDAHLIFSEDSDKVVDNAVLHADDSFDNPNKQYISTADVKFDFEVSYSDLEDDITSKEKFCQDIECTEEEYNQILDTATKMAEKFFADVVEEQIVEREQ